MMWLKLKKIFVKTMDTLETMLSTPVSVEDRLVTSENLKKFYDAVYCSFQSIVFLAALKLAIERYDTIMLKIFYYIGFCAWTMYLCAFINYLIYALLERYTPIDLESEGSRLILNFFSILLGLSSGIWGLKIIVDFVDLKFPIN